jgi:hypothetical protein
MSGTRPVRVVIDQRVPPGEYHVGGPRIVPLDADLDLELRLREVRVNSDTEAERIRRAVREAPDLEEVTHG